MAFPTAVGDDRSCRRRRWVPRQTFPTRRPVTCTVSGCGGRSPTGGGGRLRTAVTRGFGRRRESRFRSRLDGPEWPNRRRRDRLVAGGRRSIDQNHAVERGPSIRLGTRRVRRRSRRDQNNTIMLTLLFENNAKTRAVSNPFLFGTCGSAVAVESRLRPRGIFYNF